MALKFETFASWECDDQTVAPTLSPTNSPIAAPTFSPTAAPTSMPTVAPIPELPTQPPFPFPTTPSPTSSPTSAPVYSDPCNENASRICFNSNDDDNICVKGNCQSSNDCFISPDWCKDYTEIWGLWRNSKYYKDFAETLGPEYKYTEFVDPNQLSGDIIKKINGDDLPDYFTWSKAYNPENTNCKNETMPDATTINEFNCWMDCQNTDKCIGYTISEISGECTLYSKMSVTNEEESPPQVGTPTAAPSTTLSPTPTPSDKLKLVWACNEYPSEIRGATCDWYDMVTDQVGAYNNLGKLKMKPNKECNLPCSGDYDNDLAPNCPKECLDCVRDDLENVTYCLVSRSISCYINASKITDFNILTLKMVEDIYQFVYGMVPPASQVCNVNPGATNPGDDCAHTVGVPFHGNIMDESKKQEFMKMIFDIANTNNFDYVIIEPYSFVAPLAFDPNLIVIMFPKSIPIDAIEKAAFVDTPEYDDRIGSVSIWKRPSAPEIDMKICAAGVWSPPEKLADKACKVCSNNPEEYPDVVCSDLSEHTNVITTNIASDEDYCIKLCQANRDSGNGMCKIADYDSATKECKLLTSCDLSYDKPGNSLNFIDGTVITGPPVSPTIPPLGEDGFKGCVNWEDGVYYGEGSVEPGSILYLGDQGTREECLQRCEWGLTRSELDPRINKFTNPTCRYESNGKCKLVNIINDNKVYDSSVDSCNMEPMCFDVGTLNGGTSHYINWITRKIFTLKFTVTLSSSSNIMECINGKKGININYNGTNFQLLIGTRSGIETIELATNPGTYNISIYIEVESEPGVSEPRCHALLLIDSNRVERDVNNIYLMNEWSNVCTVNHTISNVKICGGTFELPGCGIPSQSIINSVNPNQVLDISWSNPKEFSFKLSFTFNPESSSPSFNLPSNDNFVTFYNSQCDGNLGDRVWSISGSGGTPTEKQCKDQCDSMEDCNTVIHKYTNFPSGGYCNMYNGVCNTIEAPGSHDNVYIKFDKAPVSMATGAPKSLLPENGVIMECEGAWSINFQSNKIFGFNLLGISLVSSVEMSAGTDYNVSIYANSKSIQMIVNGTQDYVVIPLAINPDMSQWPEVVMGYVGTVTNLDICNTKSQGNVCKQQFTVPQCDINTYYWIRWINNSYFSLSFTLKTIGAGTIINCGNIWNIRFDGNTTFTFNFLGQDYILEVPNSNVYEVNIVIDFNTINFVINNSTELYTGSFNFILEEWGNINTGAFVIYNLNVCNAEEVPDCDPQNSLVIPDPLPEKQILTIWGSNFAGSTLQFKITFDIAGGDHGSNLIIECGSDWGFYSRNRNIVYIFQTGKEIISPITLEDGKTYTVTGYANRSSMAMSIGEKGQTPTWAFAEIIPRIDTNMQDWPKIDLGNIGITNLVICNLASTYTTAAPTSAPTGAPTQAPITCENDPGQCDIRCLDKQLNYPFGTIDNFDMQVRQPDGSYANETFSKFYYSSFPTKGEICKNNDDGNTFARVDMRDTPSGNPVLPSHYFNTMDYDINWTGLHSPEQYCNIFCGYALQENRRVYDSATEDGGGIGTCNNYTDAAVLNDNGRWDNDDGFAYDIRWYKGYYDGFVNKDVDYYKGKGLSDACAQSIVNFIDEELKPECQSMCYSGGFDFEANCQWCVGSRIYKLEKEIGLNLWIDSDHPSKKYNIYRNQGWRDDGTANNKGYATSFYNSGDMVCQCDYSCDSVECGDGNDSSVRIGIGGPQNKSLPYWNGSSSVGTCDTTAASNGRHYGYYTSQTCMDKCKSVGITNGYSSTNYRNTCYCYNDCYNRYYENNNEDVHWTDSERGKFSEYITTRYW